MSKLARRGGRAAGSRSSTCWVCSCLRAADLWLKRRSQTWHPNSFVLLCVRSCFVAFDLSQNRESQ